MFKLKQNSLSQKPESFRKKSGPDYIHRCIHTIIKHNIASGILQPRNFLHIKPFTGEKHDR